MFEESMYDFVLDRFNRSIPLLGLLFLYLFWKKNKVLETKEDDAYCELMESMGEKPKFPHASLTHLKYKVTGHFLANVFGIVTSSILLFKLFWFHAILIGIIVAFILDFLFVKVAEILWNIYQPSCNEIVKSVYSSEFKEE